MINACDILMVNSNKEVQSNIVNIGQRRWRKWQNKSYMINMIGKLSNMEYLQVVKWIKYTEISQLKIYIIFKKNDNINADVTIAQW